MHTVLTIGGSDSSGGAGLQADLKTLAAHGIYGVCAVTAVTAQNTLGVHDVYPLGADLVTAQIEAVVADLGADATKIGMLATAAIVEAVASAIDALDLPRVVLDPVMVATSGRPLLDEDALVALRTELVPRAFVVTPNVGEAERLAGFSIDSVEAASRAARRIAELGAGAVILTGGHLPVEQAIDIVFDGKAVHELRGDRVRGASAHGTGCTFAAAVAANLAAGRSLIDAAAAAKEFVTGALRSPIPRGGGHRLLDHFWQTKGRYTG